MASGRPARFVTRGCMVVVIGVLHTTYRLGKSRTTQSNSFRTGALAPRIVRPSRSGLAASAGCRVTGQRGVRVSSQLGLPRLAVAGLPDGVKGGEGVTHTVFDGVTRSEEHTSALQSQANLVCRLLR